MLILQQIPLFSYPVTTAIGSYIVVFLWRIPQMKQPRCYYTKYNDNQIGAKEGKFVLLLFAIFFSAPKMS
jgi:hypothetical protein